jgi:hypothetical protein
MWSIFRVRYVTLVGPLATVVTTCTVSFEQPLGLLTELSQEEKHEFFHFRTRH